MTVKPRCRDVGHGIVGFAPGLLLGISLGQPSRLDVSGRVCDPISCPGVPGSSSEPAPYVVLGCRSGCDAPIPGQSTERGRDSVRGISPGSRGDDQDLGHTRDASRHCGRERRGHVS